MNFDDLPRSPSYYDLLGVPTKSDAAWLKKAFRAAARQHHPDRGGSHEMMVKLNAAYLVLSDPAARAAYDSWLGAESEPESERAAWEGTREARGRAEEYPAEWEAFVEWLDALMTAAKQDAAAAEFGSTEVHHGALSIPFPTVESESAVATALVGIGAVGGGGLGLVAGLGIYPHPALFIPLALMGGSVGAWAGAGAAAFLKLVAEDGSAGQSRDLEPGATRKTGPGPPRDPGAGSGHPLMGLLRAVARFARDSSDATYIGVTLAPRLVALEELKQRFELHSRLDSRSDRSLKQEALFVELARALPEDALLAIEGHKTISETKEWFRERPGLGAFLDKWSKRKDVLK